MKFENEKSLFLFPSSPKSSCDCDSDISSNVSADFTRRKRKHKPRKMSSLQVFQRFTTISSEGKKSGEKIMTRECFDFWVDTRESKVVHPEESFRRTLIAHIRGAYGRKPFHPEVEASLLSILRTTFVNGHPVNPWDRCFKTNHLNIGKRGFAKLGYHENIARMNDEKQKLKLVETSIPPAREEQDDFADILSTFFTPADLDSFDMGFDNCYAYPPAKKQQTVPHYATNFEEKRFGSDKPVGMCVINLSNMVIEASDISSSEIFLRNINNCPIIELMESPVDFEIFFAKYFPTLMESGEVWTRSRVILGDGSRKQFKFKFQITARKCCVVYFQDQTPKVENFMFF